MEARINISRLAQLEHWAGEFSLQLGPRAVVLLEGPLGAGKTTLVRTLVQQLGGHQVTSPSFAIHQQYQSARGLIDHFDFYRLKSEAELEGIGFWELLGREKGLIIIEWPEKFLDEQIPSGWKVYKIKIEMTNSDSRWLTFSD